jgi:outer membrane protein assembly factor BamD
LVSLQAFTMKSIKWIIFFAVGIAFSGCEYQKVLKKGTVEQKYKTAKKYYNKEDYIKALPLLEELVGVYKKPDQAAEIYYYYAYCHYGMGDYIMASYHFKNLTRQYGRSKYREESSYMIARCEFHKSLPYYLDQTNTKKAIEGIQLFINNNPDSKFIAECNDLMDILRVKLHKKAYETASMYYQMGRYRAASTAFKNAIIDYPDINDKEKIEYMVAKTSFIYAQRSIKKKQSERYNQALEEINNFNSSYPKSKYIKEVAKMKATSEKQEQETLQFKEATTIKN